MNTEKKELKLIFLNGVGRQHIWTPKGVREDLDAQSVEKVMNDIVSIGIFEKNGVRHCTGVVAAKYVKTVEEFLFNNQ